MKLSSIAFVMAFGILALLWAAFLIGMVITSLRDKEYEWVGMAFFLAATSTMGVGLVLMIFGQ